MFRKDLETSKLMEKWVTKRILEGQKNRRQELLKLQNKINELDAMLEFIDRKGK